MLAINYLAGTRSLRGPNFRVLVENQQFRCTPTICFGIGPVHNLFVELQQQINKLFRFGLRFDDSSKKFLPLKEDGFIGDATTNVLLLLFRTEDDVASILVHGAEPARARALIASRAEEWLTRLSQITIPPPVQIKCRGTILNRSCRFGAKVFFDKGEPKPVQVVAAEEFADFADIRFNGEIDTAFLTAVRRSIEQHGPRFSAQRSLAERQEAINKILFATRFPPDLFANSIVELAYLLNPFFDP